MDIRSEQLKQVFFSVLLVTRNEEKYIARLLDTLLEQDFSQRAYEIIIIDGLSNDNTRELIKNYQQKSPNMIRMFDNPQQTLPPGWNIGIKQAYGDYVLRIDGHTEVKANFLSSYKEAIEQEPEASCVGGIILSKGKGFQGEVNQFVFSHPFGVGRSKFRTLNKEWHGYTETVPYGAYKKEVFLEVGYFNEDLKRNEDIEFHRRMKEKGHTFYLTTDIQSVYYVRDTLKGLFLKSFGDGMWSVIANRLTPGALSFFKRLPLLAFIIGLSLVCLTIYNTNFVYLLVGCVGAYLALAAFFSIRLMKEKGCSHFFFSIVSFFCLHFARGLGSFLAYFKKEYWMIRNNIKG
ncbi:glycosyltransferase family 2 protein [Alkalihalobacillus pseudalcaliphilus]|uniref:glycosyltransferase family 2 protein n=1 Tax=Alkalihalobacillus pseudalcaliphilus TaxID=79884 RepID=UPI00064D83DC|nr:glycosyltransferase family 2 protein [Alkalihalobacillus pseudalcaliphilus]KMK77399.1 glycosyl transferase [Alkalihalobacillus pseudalcaliphilus]